MSLNKMQKPRAKNIGQKEDTENMEGKTRA